MRLLIFGSTGQVGRELGRVDWPSRVTVQPVCRSQCDLSVPARAGEMILQIRPDIVINAAAYTAVDRAESEPALAATLNRNAPLAMANACQTAGAKLVHLSTDYVFDGLKAEPYVESDPVAPLSVYGRTKADGEAAIRAHLSQHVILRTSWVFAAHGSNFVRTMLRLARERSELRIVADQRGSPTAARDIAQAIAAIVRRIADDRGFWGTFHFASGDPTTWFEFAGAIFSFRDARPRVLPITTAEYKASARRPLYSVLDCARIGDAYGIARPSWRAALADVLSELGEAVAIKGALAE